MNWFKTGILLAGLTALFMGAGFMLGGESGMLIALVVAVGMNFFAYWNADKIVLRMYNAREVNARNAPGFYGIVQQLAERAGDGRRYRHDQGVAVFDVCQLMRHDACDLFVVQQAQ